MQQRPKFYYSLPWVLTPEEVAPLLNVGMCTVYELLRSNQLKNTKIGVQYRICKEDVLEFLGKSSPPEEPITELTIAQKVGKSYGAYQPEYLQNCSSLYRSDPRSGSGTNRRIGGDNPGL